MERQACGSRTQEALRSARTGGNALSCLERPMGKKIRAREAQRRQHDNVVWTVLKSHSEQAKACAPTRAPAAFDDFSHDLHCKVEALGGYALRQPTDWHCRLKSKSEA